jgi:hypothetical protein
MTQSACFGECADLEVKMICGDSGETMTYASGTELGLDFRAFNRTTRHTLRLCLPHSFLGVKKQRVNSDCTYYPE